MTIFREQNGQLKKLKSFSIDKGKKLQELVETNFIEVLNMYFLESEHTITYGGRIDTLAIDKNGSQLLFIFFLTTNRGMNIRNNIAHSFYSYENYSPTIMFLPTTVLLRLLKSDLNFNGK